MTAATQSKGSKVKKWSGGVGIKVGEEQEPLQMHSKVIWNLGEPWRYHSEGHISLINPVSYPTASCANMWMDELSPKAS